MVNRKLFPEKSAKELLVQFRETGSQEPFEEIVRRYAAMVYGVALRVTGDKHDAEDATQAVFLSLALQAKTSREITYVGPWLQKVAHRLALDVKKAKTRRKRREEKLADHARHTNGNGHHHNGNGNGHPGQNGNGNGGGNGFFGGNPLPNPADYPGSQELKQIMMEELNKLPAKYRMPLVLHYFGGLSREEMAAELGCNPSTLGVRVHRGKAMLGTRLAKRGVAITAVAMTVVLEHVIRSTTVQPLLSTSSVASTAAGVFAGSGAPVAQASAKVIALTRLVARSLVYAKIKVALGIILLIATTAVTTGSVVAKYVDFKNFTLPSLKLGDWIRPLLRSFTSSPQANAGSENKEADVSALVSSEPLHVTIDPRNLGFASPASIDHVTALAPIRSAPTTPAKTQATPAPSAKPSYLNLPSLNAVAQATLAGPIHHPALAPPSMTLYTAPKPPSDSSDTADSTEKETAQSNAQPVINASAEGETFTLIGAGGGGGFGKPDIYVLPANTTLSSHSQVIGLSGLALFRQDGGVNRVAGALTIAKQKSAVATYQLNGGSLTAQTEVIGDEGEGYLVQTRGVNQAQNSIIVGKSGQGSYEQNGGTTTVLNVTPTADPADDPNGLHIAENPGSTGQFTLADGTLTADPQLVGKSGTGSIKQTGGKNVTGAIAVAVNPGSVGSYDLSGGKLVVDSRDSNKPVAAISIGGKGKGSFKFGSVNKTGAIYEVNGAGASVVIRGAPRANGVLSGFGKVDLTGAMVNNDQVIADGYRKERTLDLSSFAWITSTLENPRWGGDSGWFARREGRLLLPPLPFQAGTSTNTWGEDNGDPMIDMVNSVRLTVHGAQSAGDVSVALNSTLRDDLPTLPQGHKFIGVWSFDGSELGEFDGVDLTVRYDDLLARELGLSEELLKLWEYDSQAEQWKRLDHDDTFVRNTIDNILTGHANGNLSYFAVSAPEPTGITMLLITSGFTLLKRERRS